MAPVLIQMAPNLMEMAPNLMEMAPDLVEMAVEMIVQPTLPVIGFIPVFGLRPTEEM